MNNGWAAQWGNLPCRFLFSLVTQACCATVRECLLRLLIGLHLRYVGCSRLHVLAPTAATACSRLNDTELAIAHLHRVRNGGTVPITLADVIERSALESTGPVAKEEVRIMQGHVDELTALLQISTRLLEEGRLTGIEHELMACRVERAQADLAWIEGDGGQTEVHLGRAVTHADKPWEGAVVMREFGRFDFDFLLGIARSRFDAKLALVRLQDILARRQ